MNNYINILFTNISVFTGYYIEKREANTDRFVRCNQDLCKPTIFNVHHLIEDRQYEFQVYAVNEAGLSQPSSTSTSVRVKDPRGIAHVLLLVKIITARVCSLFRNLFKYNLVPVKLHYRKILL